MLICADTSYVQARICTSSLCLLCYYLVLKAYLYIKAVGRQWSIWNLYFVLIAEVLTRKTFSLVWHFYPTSSKDRTALPSTNFTIALFLLGMTYYQISNINDHNLACRRHLWLLLSASTSSYMSWLWQKLKSVQMKLAKSDFTLFCLSLIVENVNVNANPWLCYMDVGN